VPRDPQVASEARARSMSTVRAVHRRSLKADQAEFDVNVMTIGGANSCVTAPIGTLILTETWGRYNEPSSSWSTGWPRIAKFVIPTEQRRLEAHQRMLGRAFETENKVPCREIRASLGAR
jgi:hypothetical protein